jgi:hypothetical protein
MISKNAQILIYGPEKETVTGLVIVPEPEVVKVSELDFTFDTEFSDKAVEALGGLKDASGEFTGYLI